MTNLRSNLSTVQFKRFEGKDEIQDEYGNPTGSFSSRYGPLQTASLCVSANKGTSESDLFGSLEDYDRTMTTADTGCLIDENSILWLDEQPTEGPHNYVVKMRAPWKNSVAFAVKKVTISG